MTVPVPAPDFVMVSVYPNDAVTFLAALTVRVHGPVPVQSPLQPIKAAPASAVCVKITVDPLSYVLVHAGLHTMPAGELYTDPGPEMLVVTLD